MLCAIKAGAIVPGLEPDAAGTGCNVVKPGCEVVQHFDAPGGSAGGHWFGHEMHIGDGYDFDGPGGEASFAVGRQVDAGDEAIIAAAIEPRHVLHAWVQQVPHAVKDELAADALDACDGVGMVANDEINAVGVNGPVAEFLNRAG